MKPDPRDDLLADVLAETEPPDFRAALLGETLRLARRRRRVRQARRIVAAAALITLGSVLFWPRATSLQTTEIARQPPSPAGPYTLIATQPLAEAALVRTRPLPSSRIVTSVATVTTVTTQRDAPLVHAIGDSELLALAPQPAALIRVGPGAQELIFTDGEPLR